MKRTFTLSHDMARANAVQAIRTAPEGYQVVLKEPSRSLDQNAMLWSLLQCFSEQLIWPVNGQLVRLPKEEWKDVLSAAFRKETARVAMGLDGGVVMLGQRTSKMTRAQFSKFIEFIHAVAADRGVDLDQRFNDAPAPSYVAA